MKEIAVDKFLSSRELVDFVNKNKISRESIVSIFPQSGEFVIFYYKS